MTYQDALEIAIADITTRINYLGEQALEAHEEGEEEERAALRSAQGGMMECLELLTKLHALAKSIEKESP